MEQRCPHGEPLQQHQNRMHPDLAPTDRTRDEEVERLVALGASRIADHRTADGAASVVPADPEGNESWVERGYAERGPAEPKRYRIGAG
jgi:hypothetical protein